MNSGSSRIELARPMRVALPRRRRLPWLAAAMMAGGSLWLLLPGADRSLAQSEPLRMAAAEVQPPVPDPAASPAATTAPATASQAAELGRMRISSQTWRRGGLGSNALVTFTLRNDNDYAVKDIEISCAFDRGDGSHLTDRTRLLPDTVDMKSRKTYARVHVGFVNVNARRATCTPIAARRG